jgi:hypothetical protein
MLKFDKNKFAVLLLLTLLMISLVFIQIAFAQPGVAYIEPPIVYTNVCEEFTVTVIADVVVPIQMFEFYLIFDPSQMAFINVMVIPPWVQSGLNVGPNYIWVQGYDGLVGPGLVPLAEITFHCIASGISDLMFDFVYVMDDHGDMWSLPWKGATVTQYDFYWKPLNLIDYAPSGVPDFDQKQDAWTNPRTGQWSYCGPTAIANSFWWLDSSFEPNPVAPPTINDNFPLVWSYNQAWDDHDPQNVGPLIEDLAWYMDTDGKQTGSTHNGTKVMDMARGIDQYLFDHGLDNKFYQKTVKAPNFYYIEEEVEKCEDVTLLLGFWQTDGAKWWRVGGHYVTVAGVDSTGLLIAFSDPCIDNAEAGRPGVVLPGPHGYPHSSTVHNDTQFVSHDIYAAWVPGHGGSPGNPFFEVGYNEYEIEEWYFLISQMAGQNCPDEFASQSGPYNPLLTVYTEVEYAVIVSCETGKVAAGSEDGYVYVHDFYGNLLWYSWAEAYCVSVAFDNEADYLAAGWRYSDYGYLAFFDANAVTGGGYNTPLWYDYLAISESYHHLYGYDSSGHESMSVDTKYNAYNQFYIVAAAHDYGLNLYDEWGNLIWQYFDEEGAETIVRISQDGNYIVCADGYNSGTLHYFSHLRDGVPGWGPGDGIPIWSFGGYQTENAVHWTAVSGIGDYVAVSGWNMGYGADVVVLLNRTGNIVWQHLGAGGLGSHLTKVDMPCHGRSVVAATEDLSDSYGCDLYYFNDGGNGWDSGDGTPVWTYWPGLEVQNPHDPYDDFYTVSISGNGDVISAGGWDGTSNLYVLDKSGTVINIIDDGTTLHSVDVTFNGRYTALGTGEGYIALYDKDISDWKWAVSYTSYPIRSVAISKIYPCMFPYPNHDVAVIEIRTCKDGCIPIPIISQNLTAHVNVTVRNQGDFTETFQLTVYANNTPINTTTVFNLAAGHSITLTLKWNTTGFAKGNYTIWACASIVSNEINVYDNTRINGLIAVVLPGDINADGTVGLVDLVALARAYGVGPSAPNYNPNADFNDDHTIGLADLVIMARFYGQSDP